MEEHRAIILEYMQLAFARTRWPFFNRIKIVNTFGPVIDEALESLFSQGIVLPRVGTQGPLVEYVADQDRRERVKAYYIKTKSINK